MTDPKKTMKILYTTALLLAGFVSRATTLDQHQEATHYFSEFKRLHRKADYAGARKKLNTAIALDAKNYGYYKALLKLNKLVAERSCKAANMLKALKINLNMIAQMKKNFPQNDELFMPDYLDWNLSNVRRQLSKAEIVELQKLAKVYRPVFLENIKRKYFKFDLTNGINSVKEWEAYFRYNTEACFFSLYWNADQWGKVNYQAALQMLELGKQFFDQNPSAKGREMSTACLDLMLLAYRRANKNSVIGREIRKAVVNVIRNSVEYIDKAKNDSSSPIQASGLMLELLRNSILSKYNETAFEQHAKKYYQAINKLKLDKNQRKRCTFVPVFFLTHGSNLSKVLWRTETESLNVPVPKKRHVMPVKYLVTQIKKAKKPLDKAHKALELMPQIRHYEAQELTSPEVWDFFRDIRHLAEPDMFRKTDPAFAKLRKELNHGVEIKTLCNLDKLYGEIVNSSGIKFANAVWNNNTLYLLLLETKRIRHTKPFRFTYQHRWNVGQFDFKSGKLRFFSLWSDWKSQRVSRFDPKLFAVNGQFAICGFKDNINVFPLNGGKPKRIEDLPGDIVNAIALLGQRIYAFTGRRRNNRAAQTILFSCQLDGGDRKMNISMGRTQKQNSLERHKPFVVNGMYADETRKRLIFSCSGPNGSSKIKGLWEFYPDSGKSACLYNSNRPIDKPIIRAGNKIFFSFWRENFCIYDLEKSRAKLFLSIVDKKAEHFIKVKYRSANGIFYNPPFFARPKQLWLGGESKIQLISLPDYNKSPLIIMPRAATIKTFPHPDGKSAITIDSRKINIITPGAR
jgi:hypothetical protein